jgi:Domain of unknown function (DUF5134)
VQPGASGREDGDVSGPAWLAGSVAVLMVVIAAYCACRLAISWLRRKDTERDADALHVLMGAAMAGMLEPRLTPIPGTAWRAVFAAAAAWFAWQAIRAGRRGAAGTRCAYPVPHAVESAAMVYMLLPVGSWPSGHGPGMAMPGMGQGATAGNPALTLVLALFMLGYVLWATDRLARLARASAVAPARSAAAPRPSLAAVTVPAAASAPGAPLPDPVAPERPPGRAVLAPRLAACYKVAMGIAMGYMLIMML